MATRSSRFNRKSKTTPSRVFTSTALEKISTEELNQLFTKVGRPQQDPDKLSKALKYSVLCIAAISFRDQRMVGFVRATGDGVFNITIWDLVVDPELEDVDATKLLLLQRLKREVKKSGLQCAISIFAEPYDQVLLQEARFAEDAEGITAMTLGPDDC